MGSKRRTANFPVNVAASNAPPHVVILGAGASRACLPDGDAEGRPLPVMADLVQMLDLQPLLDAHGIEDTGTDFEEVCARLRERGKAGALAEMEHRLTSYFGSLRLPAQPTLYDRLIASLRSKDLIATFNWDPLLIQAFARSAIPLENRPQVVFLHGSVAVGICLPCRAKSMMSIGYCRECGRAFEPVRLLYPIHDKSYTDDPFIRGEWEILKQRLGAAYIVTVYGYGAPQTDAAAVDMLHVAASSAGHWMQEQRQMEIIDIRAREDLERSWTRFFRRSHSTIAPSLDGTFLHRYPRRSCEGMMSCLLQNDPWPNNPLPDSPTIEQLYGSVRPMVKAE